jgi:hypothetical protein
MYTRDTKFLVELAPEVELIPKCSWKLEREEIEAAEPWSHAKGSLC